VTGYSVGRNNRSDCSGCGGRVVQRSHADMTLNSVVEHKINKYIYIYIYIYIYSDLLRKA
jgi:hypothetical protein